MDWVFCRRTVGKLKSFKSHSFSLRSYKPALLPEDICSFPLLPHCRRIKLFLSAVSWLILFSHCSSFSGRGVSKIYSFHYLRLKLLMSLCWLQGAEGRHCSIWITRLQGSLAEDTGHDSSPTHPLQWNANFIAQCELFSPDSQTMVKTWGFSSVHLTQVKLVFFPSRQFQNLTLGYGHKLTVDLSPVCPPTCPNWINIL